MFKRILIVDDSATTRAMIKRVIRVTGLEVNELLDASDGLEALAALGPGGIDLVLADLNMPNMDGMEMIRHMRQREATRHIPVIVISAQPDPELAERLKSEGVVGYLSKPFTPESMRDLVGKILLNMGDVHAAA